LLPRNKRKAPEQKSVVSSSSSSSESVHEQNKDEESNGEMQEKRSLFEQGWQVVYVEFLKPHLEKIRAGGTWTSFSNVAFSKYFTLHHDLCYNNTLFEYNISNILFEKFLNMYKGYLDDMLNVIDVCVQQQHTDIQLVQIWTREWTQFNEVVKFLSKFFTTSLGFHVNSIPDKAKPNLMENIPYLKEYYENNRFRTDISLNEWGYRSFYELVFAPRQEWLSGLLQRIISRGFEVSDTSTWIPLFKTSIQYISELGKSIDQWRTYVIPPEAKTNENYIPPPLITLFSTCIGDPLLSQTAEYFKNKSEEWRQTASLQQYVQHAFHAMDAETKFLNTCLGGMPLFMKKVMETCKHALLKAPLDSLLSNSTDMYNLISQEKSKEISDISNPRGTSSSAPSIQSGDQWHTPDPHARLMMMEDIDLTSSESISMLSIGSSHGNTDMSNESSTASSDSPLSKYTHLTRLYSLYETLPEEMKKISAAFQQIIVLEGTQFLKETQKSSSNSKMDTQAVSSSITSAGFGNNSTPTSSSATSSPSLSLMSKGTVDATYYAMIQGLVSLYSHYRDVVHTCFSKSSLFQIAIRQGFSEVLNKQDLGLSRILARFSHELLKKGSKIAQTHFKDTQVEQVLESIVFLYSFVEDKDIFEHDYQSALASRLLSNSYESEFIETSMISKLKQEAGYQWTNTLESMFRDIQLSKELMAKYTLHVNAQLQQQQSSSSVSGPQITVNVCTGGIWPNTRATTISMPTSLIQPSDHFKQFYLSEYSGRKLDWRYEEGTAEVAIKFRPDYKRTLVVSTYQMLLLSVLKDLPIVTLKQFADIIGLPIYEFGNALLSLCHPKVAILIKQPNVKKLDASDKFQLNRKYQHASALLRIVVPTMNLMDKQEGTNEAEAADAKRIEIQRNHQIDACCTRIMKSRKEMLFQALIVEAMEQLKSRFKPLPQDIKKRIESLIELEYMERDKAERNKLLYKA